jgi:outer membrane autotransporter protein
MGEIDFTVKNNKVNFLYNVGLKYNLAKNLDLRGGLHGSVGDGQSQVSFGLGVGVKF